MIVNISSNTHLSTISNIDGVKLCYEVWYPKSQMSPVVAFLEGYDGTASDMPAVDKERLASYGFFCVFPYLRGRGDSGGVKDTNGYEVQDIVDCITAARVLLSEAAHPTAAYVVGYSGGGGNVLGCLARFPDYFAAGVDHFGISSYREWWKENTGYRAKMNLHIGGDVSSGTYASREMRDAIDNYTGGFLYIFHDPADKIVLPSQSKAVATTLDKAGLSNYKLDMSQAWGHSYPIQSAEPYWVPKLASIEHPSWMAPSVGRLKIPGYLESSHFRVMLDVGLDNFGLINYDINAHVFKISAHHKSAQYTMKLKHQIPNTLIHAEINGVSISQMSDDDGTVLYTGNAFYLARSSRLQNFFNRLRQ